MGHVVTECGDGIHDPDTCEWGNWLPVNFETSSRGQTSGWAPHCGGGMGRGGGFGRRRGNPGDPNTQVNMDIDINEGLEKTGLLSR